MVKAIPWWSVGAAAACPILLIGGFSAAAALQPASYDPVRNTISELASQGATDSWVMTAALAGVGLCYLVVAIGLWPARAAGRVVLSGGGVATLLIALFQVPSHGYSYRHELAVILTVLFCCSWPAFASRPGERLPLLRPAPSFAAAGVSLGLAAWYALESHGALLGLAERCAAIAPPLWLLAVVITSELRLRQGISSERTSLSTRPSEH
jgi:hypothetical membrane protein